MRVTFIRLLYFVKPGLILLPRQSQWATGRRSVVFVFAEPLRQLHREMKNPAHLSGLVHVDNFIRTRQLTSIYQDCAKTNPTATQTTTNHTAGR
jgi:hypothetical protein